MPCRYPGCVAEVERGDVCPVHRANNGKACEACSGRGVRVVVDLRAAICDLCGGVGLADHRRSLATPKAERVAVDDRGLMELLKQDTRDSK